MLRLQLIGFQSFEKVTSKLNIVTQDTRSANQIKVFTKDCFDQWQFCKTPGNLKPRIEQVVCKDHTLLEL